LFPDKWYPDKHSVATEVEEHFDAPFGQAVAAVLQFPLAKTNPVAHVSATLGEEQVRTFD